MSSERRRPDPLAGVRAAAARLRCCSASRRISELIKRIAFLQGLVPTRPRSRHGKTAEEDSPSSCCRRKSPRARRPHGSASHDRLLIAEHGADHVRGADRLPAVRLFRWRSRSAACGLFFGFIGIELGLIPPTLLQALPLRIFGIMQNDTLLAIPFFTFMGLILERSGMAEDLLDTDRPAVRPDPRRPGLSR